MNRKKRNQGHAGRLQTGKLVLAAAESVDTTLIAPRLAAFSQLHSQLLEAMTRVDTAQASVAAATDQVTHCAALLDAALDKLIAQLVVDGQPRLNPFTVYTADTPSSIKLLTPADRSTTVQRLLRTILRDERLSPGSRDAANACAVAATAVDTALANLDSVDDAADDARNARDATADRWDDALAALKRGARAAADDGATGLYTALFDRIAKPTSSKSRTPRTDQPASAARCRPRIPPGIRRVATVSDHSGRRMPHYSQAHPLPFRFPPLHHAASCACREQTADRITTQPRAPRRLALVAGPLVHQRDVPALQLRCR